jgi:hypothetical protein
MVTYIPNESPENSRQENLKIFKNRHIHKKFHISECISRKNLSCLIFYYLWIAKIGHLTDF